jgi:hypothetical protein
MITVENRPLRSKPLKERNGDFSPTENKPMNTGGKIFIKGRGAPISLPPTVLGMTANFRVVKETLIDLWTLA